MIDYKLIKKKLESNTIKNVELGGTPNKQGDFDYECILSIELEDGSFLYLGSSDGCCVVDIYKDENGIETFSGTKWE